MESGFWPKSERLFCRTATGESIISLPRTKPIFGLGEHAAELFIEYSSLDIVFMDNHLHEGTYDGRLANLKSLSIYECRNVELDTLKCIIMPPLRSGSLEMLQLSPYPFPSQRTPTEDDYSWLRNDCVKHLTIGGLNLQHGIIDLDATLTSIVQQFDALDSLDIGKEIVRTSTLMSLIKERGIRSLYHTNPELPTYDLQTWARDKELGDVQKRRCPGSIEERQRHLYDNA